MPELYKTFDLPPIVDEDLTQSNKQKSSVYFDFNTGDFACDKSGKLITATPYEAWCQWCMKTVYTQRSAFLGYSDQIGAELLQAFNQDKRKLTESTLTRTITEALLADPYGRTKRVYDFVFNWSIDILEATFTVAGVWDKDATMTVRFKEGGMLWQMI